MNITGDWPGPIGLRSGWARAEGRRWNDQIPDGHLRLVRGSAPFLERCVDALGEFGCEGVASPPLLTANLRVWERAGFEPYLTLDLFRRGLAGSIDTPSAPVHALDPPPWEQMVEIDAGSFAPLWQMNLDGLIEAFGATTTAAVLVTGDDDDITGFSIVGVGGTMGYLQRIAVRPGHRGEGLGRALVRASMGWAMKRGGHSMLLNTQPENDASAALYVTEGFEAISPGLRVLRRSAG